MKKLRPIVNNNYGSAIPIILYTFGLLGAGALYHLLFIQIGLPIFSPFIPTDLDPYRYVVLGIIYFLPLLILLMAIFSIIHAGLKRFILVGGE